MYSTPVVILCFYSNILYTIFFVFFVISLKKFLSTNIIFLLIAFLAALWISTLWSVFFSFFYAVRNHALSTNFIHLSIICTSCTSIHTIWKHRKGTLSRGTTKWDDKCWMPKSLICSLTIEGNREMQIE